MKNSFLHHMCLLQICVLFTSFFAQPLGPAAVSHALSFDFPVLVFLVELGGARFDFPVLIRSQCVAEFPVHFAAREASFLVSCSKARLCFPDLVSPLIGLARFLLQSIFSVWLLFVSFSL
jgi:hypothetical protein